MSATYSILLGECHILAPTLCGAVLFLLGGCRIHISGGEVSVPVWSRAISTRRVPHAFTDTAYFGTILLGRCKCLFMVVKFSHCLDFMQGIIKEVVVHGGEELAWRAPASCSFVSADSGSGRVAVCGGRLPRP